MAINVMMKYHGNQARDCMKTEFYVASEYAGVVKEVLSKEWDEVQVGDPMVILEIEG